MRYCLICDTDTRSGADTKYAKAISSKGEDFYLEHGIMKRIHLSFLSGYPTLIAVIFLALAGAVIVLALAGDGWPSLRSRPLEPVRAVWVQPDAAKTPEEADEMLERIAQAGFNTVLYGIYPSDVYYRSELLPRSSYVTSEYDPLAYVVQHGHALGLKVQAWWSCGAAPRFESFRNQHPDWDIARLSETPDDIHWLDFSLPEVRQFVGDVVLEIAQNYEVDGVHLDYIRYPSDVKHSRTIFGRDDVPSTVRSVYQRLKLVEPDVELTAAVLSGQAASNALLQNWAEWLEGDYIDRVFPMAYVDPENTHFSSAADWTLDRDIEEWQKLPHSEKIVAGLKVLLRDDSATKTSEEFMTQVELCSLGGFDNIAVFDERSVTDEILEALANDVE